MFTKHVSGQHKTPLPGIQMKTLCYGDRTLVTEFILEQGSPCPTIAKPAA